MGKLIREDFVKALNELDTYIDITVEDLMDINARAEKYARIRLTENLLVANLMSQPVVTVQPDFSLVQQEEEKYRLLTQESLAKFREVVITCT